jgi:hypothetical protein
VVFWDVRRVALVKPEFKRNVSPPFQGENNEGTKNSLALFSNCSRLATANVFLAGYFHLDDGGDTFLRNVCSYKSHIA